MEYVYTIVAYKIIQYFKGICITVKTDKQIFFTRVIIIGFVQQTVIYSRIKCSINICFAYFVIKRGTFALRARLRFKSGGIELNNKIHVSSIYRFLIK